MKFPSREGHTAKQGGVSLQIGFNTPRTLLRFFEAPKERRRASCQPLSRGELKLFFYPENYNYFSWQNNYSVLHET